MSKHSETHANGAGIEIRGSRRYIRSVIAEWRASQQFPQQQEQEFPQNGSEAHTHLAEQRRGYWGEPIEGLGDRTVFHAQKIGFAA